MRKSIFVKRTLSCLMIVLMAVVGSACNQVKNDYAVSTESKIKNVILMISDGASLDAFTLARLYQKGLHGGNLEIQDYFTGLVKTSWADGPITDSAPSATAYATGIKSFSNGIGSVKENDLAVPKATLFEAAKKKGMSTGLVVTCEFMHATPAAFTSHVEGRADYETISEQMLHNNLDVVLGGGADISGDFNKANRGDGEDLVKEAKEMGYEYMTSFDEVKATQSNKIWGVFAKGALPYDIDRDPEKDPSLSQMTDKALEVLSKNEKGFMLMVEGSKIDSGGHNNDPVTVISETLAYNEAFKKAVEFAKSREDTVVISVSDHSTGGISIGSIYSKDGYNEMNLDSFIKPLKKAKMTAEGALELLKKDKSNAKAVLGKYGISNPTAKELAAFKKKPEVATMVQFMQSRSKIGFTSPGHTGGDVGVFMYSPDKKLINGVVENTEINKYVCDLIGINLSDLSKELYNPIVKLLESKGLTYQLNEDGSIGVKTSAHEITIPNNKNYVLVDGEKKIVSGVNILFSFEIFVCKDVIDLLSADK